MVPALILASGSSTRMGRSKALLDAGTPGVSFVRRLSEAIRAAGVADVVVVGRPGDRALVAEVETLGTRVRFAPNANAESGQLSSIVAGLNLVDHPGIRGVLITPVDLPLVRPETVRALLDRFQLSPLSIVRPAFESQHGHPVIFPRGLFDELRRADPAQGAKAVLRRHPSSIEDVPVGDPGVVNDIDDPADYARVFGRSPI